MSEQRSFQRADGIVVALLVIACALFAWRAPAALPSHLALLVGFVIAVRVRVWRAVAVVAVLMTLSSALAEPAFLAMEGSRDAWLASLDRALFAGRDPALLVVPSHLEVYSFIYAFFIAYLGYLFVPARGPVEFY